MSHRDVGLLFREEQVRAILRGQQTATRRPHGFATVRTHAREVVNDAPDMWSPGEWQRGLDERGSVGMLRAGRDYLVEIKPRLVVGDTMCVQETYCSNCCQKPESARDLCFKANLRDQPAADFCVEGRSGKITWHPGMYMPKTLARIRRTITRVRVERLQQIVSNQGDAIAEGMLFLGGIADNWDEAPWADPLDPDQRPFKFPSAAFLHMWVAMHGVRSWRRNPWVFVYEWENPL